MYLMTRWISAGLVMAAMAAMARGGEIAPGATLRDVLAELGQPRGYIRSEGYLFLDYERGKIELQSNVVVKATLMSEQELADYKVLAAKQAEQDRLLAEARRVQRISEGTRVRSLKLADPYFMGLPASERVAYWRAFRVKYPEVDIETEYAVAMREYEIELAEQARDAAHARDVADLERRVEEAEREAEAARHAQARAEAYSRYFGYSYVRPIYCPPVVVSRPTPIPCSPVAAVPRPGFHASVLVGSQSTILAPYPGGGNSMGWTAR